MDFAPVPRNAVGASPYGPEDEIGRLNPADLGFVR
jgi:hypothetical protein